MPSDLVHRSRGDHFPQTPLSHDRRNFPIHAVQRPRYPPDSFPEQYPPYPPSENPARRHPDFQLSVESATFLEDGWMIQSLESSQTLHTHQVPWCHLSRYIEQDPLAKNIPSRSPRSARPTRQSSAERPLTPRHTARQTGSPIQ